jgi:omega-6 fatty acid desaturase (delta-12 desaturase)
MIASLVLFATKINTFPDFLQIPAWLFYFVFQGFVGVGIWILAHECGHGAFSDYTTLNSVVGWVLHSIDLIPFFSWKYTHAKHHKATGHMTKDMVFIPSTRSMLLGRDGRAAEYQGPVDPMIEDEEHLLEETPLYAVLFLTGILLAGFPAYLLYNLGGQPQKQWVSHYFPNAPIFDAHQYRGVVISNIGLLLWISILTTIGYLHGFMIPFLYFVVPWMQVNAWLVVITYLQHTDGKIPRYNNDEFDFLRGALATVDRDWGFLNAFFHHITGI